MRVVPVVLWALATGCAAPVVAPQDLDELTSFLVENFENETSTELSVGGEQLQALLEDVPLDGSIADRSFTVSALSEASLGGMPAHSGFNEEAQAPVAIAWKSRFDVEEHLRIVAETNQVCIESGTTKYYGRTFVTDLSEFESQASETLKTTNEVRKESILGRVWYDIEKEYRWVKLPNDEMAVISRSWAPQAYPTDNGGGSFDQTYVLEVWLPDGTETVRYSAMWSSVTLAGISPNAWAGLVRNGLDEGGRFADDYLDDFADRLCTQDRNRTYDRPQ